MLTMPEHTETVNEDAFMDAYRRLKTQFKRKYSLEAKESFSQAWITYYRYFVAKERNSALIEDVIRIIETVGGKKPKPKLVRCPHCRKDFTP